MSQMAHYNYRCEYMRNKNENHYIKIIEFVNNYYYKYDRSPSTREIAESINVSRPTVQRYLKDLKADGIIEYDGHRHIVTDYIRENSSINFNRIPIAGTIPCGDLNEMSEQELEYYFLPKELTGDGEFFLLKAVGNSMIDVGINNDDLVLVKKQLTADSNQIVAVLYETSQTTLKRIYFKKDHIVLHPENKGMKDIVIKGNDREKLRIQGVAIKVIKDIK